MPRILFEKKGNAVWISHLDLMRLFQRAFKRAGLPLTHTQGFNPRPSVSIALPLSVSFLDTVVTMEYDAGVPEGAAEQIRELFSREEVLVEKKAKSGEIQDQNIIPMIKSMDVIQPDEHTIELHGRVCCQNPTLNPMQLHAALVRHLPQYVPDFAKSKRIEIYDADGNIFR